MPCLRPFKTDCMMKPFFRRKHFLSGASPKNLMRILWNNRTALSYRNILPILVIFLTPVLLTPLYLLEWLIFNSRIRKTKINKDPLFIIGHFRTGTTYLHNLLSQDRQFGFPTTYQCFVPGIFLTGGGLTKKIHKTTLPEKRPMDDVLMDSDLPQEEEFAVLALTPYSYYQCYFFPQKTKEYFLRFFKMDQPLEPWCVSRSAATGVEPRASVPWPEPRPAAASALRWSVPGETSWATHVR